MDRVILHCDCNAYFASVECLFRPELKDVPMAICGDPESRHGIILAKNEKAKAFGIKTAETIWEAKKKCPELILCPARREAYSHYCRVINEIYGQYTDQVEPASIDESYLDVTGSVHLFGTGRQIADTLRRRVREEVGVTISVGVSFNKTFAKLGSDYKKPDATTEITRENYREILFPLPVEDLLYIGKKAAPLLHEHGIHTIGDFVAAEPERVTRLLGKNGVQLQSYANGMDESPVLRPGEAPPAKSVGNGKTYARDLRTREEVRGAVLALSDHVATRLRETGMDCASVQLQIKNPQLKVISRQKTLMQPTDLAREIAQTAMEIYDAAWTVGKPIRMLTVTAQQLIPKSGGRQITLLGGGEKREKQARLEGTLDKIRSRFGFDAVTLGAQVPGVSSHDEETEK